MKLIFNFYKYTLKFKISTIFLKFAYTNKNFLYMPKRSGRKSEAQTPAPQKEQIRGSKVNPKGSASSEKSATKIKLDAKTLVALTNKLKEFKDKHPNKSNITLADLKAVYRRGAGAYSSSHRPTISGGKPNTRNAWAMARVNKFLLKAGGTKVKKAYVQDDDLMKMHLGGDMSKHLAPNGKPSNLTHEQWHLVRTPEFKAWFGDWENDPKNASKVVDENGEPFVIYHASPKDFYIFSKKESKHGLFHFGTIGQAIQRLIYFIEAEGFSLSPFLSSEQQEDVYENDIYWLVVYYILLRNYLSEDKHKQYFDKYFDNKGISEKNVRLINSLNINLDISLINKELKKFNVKPYFLNIKNIGETSDVGENWHLENDFYDGYVYLNEFEGNMEEFSYIAFEPTQIKLADGSNTTFDGSNPDIRYDDGGEVYRAYSKDELMFKDGGLTDEDKEETYKKWKSLVNMSKSELERFYNSQEGIDAGLSSSEAKAQGIDSGRESARWIMKMKDTPYKEWTPQMWKWAKKQISFISRMSGNKGGLYDDKGRKTRKHTSLLIWGNNPEKMSGGGQAQYHLGGDMSKHLAPNGKPSKLNHEQWHLVRTPEFKAWFGDWEKYPKKSSKVVDNNGEPLVVYHGTNAKFTIFDTDEDSVNRKGGIWNAEYPDGYIFMTSDKKTAKRYGQRIIPLFVNLKYPIIKKVKLGESLVKPFDDDGLAFQGDAIVTDGKDYIIGTMDEFSVKLADGTNKTFDDNDPDIRYARGGETKGEATYKDVVELLKEYQFRLKPKRDNRYETWRNSTKVNGEEVDCFIDTKEKRIVLESQHGLKEIGYDLKFMESYFKKNRLKRNKYDGGGEIPENILVLLKEKKEIYNKVDQTSENLNRIVDKGRSPMGGASDKVRATKEFQIAKSEYDKAFAMQRAFNSSPKGKELQKYLSKLDRMQRMKIMKMNYNDGGEINQIKTTNMDNVRFNQLPHIDTISEGDNIILHETVFAGSIDQPKHMGERYIHCKAMSKGGMVDTLNLEVIKSVGTNPLVVGQLITRPITNVLVRGRKLIVEPVAQAIEFKDGGLNPDNKQVKNYFAHGSGNAGGVLVGKRHSEGGIKAINKSTGQPLEMEGGEVVITRGAVSNPKKYDFDGKEMTTREILSKLNVDGGGVSFAEGGDVPEKMNCGCKEFKLGGQTITPQEFIAMSEKQYDEYRYQEGLKKERHDHYDTFSKLNAGTITIDSALSELVIKEMSINKKYPFSE
jgi:hypothetical protein